MFLLHTYERRNFHSNAVFNKFQALSSADGVTAVFLTLYMMHALVRRYHDTNRHSIATYIYVPAVNKCCK